MIKKLSFAMLGGLLATSQAFATQGFDWYTGEVISKRNAVECVVTNVGIHGFGTFTAYLKILDEDGNVRASRGPVNVPEFKSRSVSHSGSGIRWCIISTSSNVDVAGRIVSIGDDGMSVDGSEIQNLQNNVCNVC